VYLLKADNLPKLIGSDLLISEFKPSELKLELEFIEKYLYK
jgi:hypothetical protein